MPRILNSRQFTDGSTALPVASGAAYISDPGTTNEKTVYSDEAETVPVSQPISLDSEGRITTALYTSSKFRLQIYDSTDTGSRDGVLVLDDDDLRGAGELGDTALTSPLKLDDSTSTAAPVLTVDGDEDTGVAHPAADTLALVTGGTERARLDSSGNLGLGTTSPAEVVDVVGSVKGSGSHYSSEGTFTVTAAGTTTEVISGLATRAAYLVTFNVSGTNMELSLMGVVLTAGPNVIVSVATLDSGDFSAGSIALQTRGNNTQFTFSSGNGNAFQFVVTGDGAADRTATYRLLRLF